MDENFSKRVKDVISFSKDEAFRLGNEYIGTEHLLLGLIREGACVDIPNAKVCVSCLLVAYLARHLLERLLDCCL